MKETRHERRKVRVRQEYSAQEIMDIIRDLSYGGHPDDYIPETAKGRFGKGVFFVEWEE